MLKPDGLLWGGISNRIGALSGIYLSFLKKRALESIFERAYDSFNHVPTLDKS